MVITISITDKYVDSAPQTQQLIAEGSSAAVEDFLDDEYGLSPTQVEIETTVTEP